MMMVFPEAWTIEAGMAMIRAAITYHVIFENNLVFMKFLHGFYYR
jgi:hypothetical protein